MFRNMSDWCMAKDYNGAERFNDGSRPLIAETEFADVIISGIPGKHEVSISVHHGDEEFFCGELATKESAKKVGAYIVNHINSHGDGPAMFRNGSFRDFFNSLQIAGIHTSEQSVDRLPNRSGEELHPRESQEQDMPIDMRL